MRMFLLLPALAIASSVHAQTIAFTAEVYPPYAYRDGLDYKGIAVDQIREIMKTVPVPYTIELLPWARAYALALTQPLHCVFATAHNTERDTLFTWVEPLLVDRSVLIARKDSGISPKTLDEAKAYVVGTHRGDYTESILKENGFPKIDLASDTDATLKKLLNGRIDLMPISDLRYAQLRKEGIDVQATTLFTEQKFGIACNKGFPAPLAAELQAALDKLIASGKHAQLLTQYGLPPMP